MLMIPLFRQTLLFLTTLLAQEMRPSGVQVRRKPRNWHGETPRCHRWETELNLDAALSRTRRTSVIFQLVRHEEGHTRRMTRRQAQSALFLAWNQYLYS